MFTNAIVRKPASSIERGITNSPQFGKPDFQKSLLQHQSYINALKKCNVKVEIIDSNELFPDSCFIEDVAVCTKEFAMITNPKEKSRSGETKGIKEILSKYYSFIETINYPGTLEGGDVMMVGQHFYVGLSNRTNVEGAKQLINMLKKYGMSGSVIKMNEMLHLKTGLSYLQDNILLITGEFINMKEFDSFDKIIVDEDESYAANCIRVNGYVIIPKGYPKTKNAIEKKGFKTIEVNTSEFKKIDGGLSCLSLRF